MEKIRMIVAQDIPALKSVLNTIELFPSEMLEDMISDYHNNPSSTDIWFTAEENGMPVSIGYCVPEKLTEATYNLLAIGVRSDIQSRGIGKAMMDFIEGKLQAQNARILIVETSSTEAFSSTRRFYEKLGYTREAIIRDYWSEGDDKIIYWKKLN